MKKFIPLLKKTSLFAGISSEETEAMLDCLGASVVTYRKGDCVFRRGQAVESIAILVSGKLHIQKDDYWGNRSIVSIAEPGDMFGEAYAVPGSGGILNDVTAVEESTVMFFDINKILGLCPNTCKFHSAVVRNLFFTVSLKNRQLVQKLGHMSRRTTREKLLSYLSEQAQKYNSSQFEIPFNRQQLADFLSVDRSAMSNELCKLRDEGVIKFNKSRFELL